MTEEIAELQAIAEELAGDITRIDRHIDTYINTIKDRFEQLEAQVEVLTKNHAAAIKVLDNRINMLKDGHNMHSQIIAGKFPEIKRVTMTEGPTGPEKGKTGPN